jgi:hypothetical protein
VRLLTYCGTPPTAGWNTCSTWPEVAVPARRAALGDENGAHADTTLDRASLRGQQLRRLEQDQEV